MSGDSASRRDFLINTGVFGLAAILPRTGSSAQRPLDRRSAAVLQEVPFRRAAPQLTELTPGTFAEAEKLAGISFTDDERAMMAESILEDLSRSRRRLDFPLHPNDLAPATRFDPRLPGMEFPYLLGRFARRRNEVPPLPEDDAEIAYSPVAHLSRWIEHGELTSVHLTEIYLERLKQYDEQLNCVITLTEDLAMSQAERADAEIKAGRYRGPLHGIPWGAKDLLDTAGIATTWGAEPFKDRVPDTDAAVVQKLKEAGAVLVAKLSLGAIAYNDIWFGGRTNNPWNLEQGSSGSSAGSAAATAAGLVGFSIGTETYGSIVSPCMRCGTTGLRPTFGRVGRGGAMTLCWSLDKIGPICRTVEDCILVLNAINGFDRRDPSSIEMPLAYEVMAPIVGMRVGYVPSWFQGERSHPLDVQALEVVKSLGVRLVEVELPELPYETLVTILHAEAAACFEELTRTGMDDLLTWQEPVAWPNTFRKAWFIPAIEMVQADRLRRTCMEVMARVFEGVQAIITPSFRLLLITNATGHPSLTLRSGFSNSGTPHGITLIGRLFDEGTICRLGDALEHELDVWDERPFE